MYTLFQDKNGFIEEAVVRSELSDNFCFYNPNYDSIEGGSDWARKTLQDHAKDKREYVYTEKVKCQTRVKITAYYHRKEYIFDCPTDARKKS